jgi:CBS domain containing-hemolysin-like protein
LQKLPAGGEAFDYENRRFVVEKVEGHRIATIRIEPKPVTPQAPSASAATMHHAGD